MKKLFILFVTALLAGCAGTMPKQADFDIDIGNQNAGRYPPAVSATVIGRDDRSEPYVIDYDAAGESRTKISSRIPPRIQLQESLERGLRRQGLKLREGADTAIVVEVKELLAKVTRPGMLYTAKVSTRLRLLVDNHGSRLTLDYNRETDSDSLTRPKVLDLELMINEQLSDIIQKILRDDRVRTAIVGGQE